MLYGCFIDSVFWVYSDPAVPISQEHSVFFNHSGLPSSSKSKFDLLYNFQDHSLMIDTNIFLFKQIVFTLNVALFWLWSIYIYMCAVANISNLPLPTLKQN